jgi:hypothetical protein
MHNAKRGDALQEENMGAEWIEIEWVIVAA